MCFNKESFHILEVIADEHFTPDEIKETNKICKVCKKSYLHGGKDHRLVQHFIQKHKRMHKKITREVRNKNKKQ